MFWRQRISLRGYLTSISGFPLVQVQVKQKYKKERIRKLIFIKLFPTDSTIWFRRMFFWSCYYVFCLFNTCCARGCLSPKLLIILLLFSIYSVIAKKEKTEKEKRKDFFCVLIKYLKLDKGHGGRGKFAKVDINTWMWTLLILPRWIRGCTCIM